MITIKKKAESLLNWLRKDNSYIKIHPNSDAINVSPKESLRNLIEALKQLRDSLPTISPETYPISFVLCFLTLYLVVSFIPV